MSNRFAMLADRCVLPPVGTAALAVADPLDGPAIAPVNAPMPRRVVRSRAASRAF